VAASSPTICVEPELARGTRDARSEENSAESKLYFAVSGVGCGRAWGVGATDPRVARSRDMLHPVVMMRALLPSVFLFVAAWVPFAADKKSAVYEGDVAFLLKELGKGAHDLLKAKGVDWKGVEKEFSAAAKKTKTDEEHVKLCARLVARLKDCHATLLDVAVKMPDEGSVHGVGLCLCEGGGKVWVKQAFGPAGDAMSAGDEVVSIEGKKASDWIGEKAKELSDEHGFSTEHAARYAACHWGFAAKDGTSFSLEIDRAVKGKKKVTLTCDRAGGEARYVGGVFPPKDLQPLGKRDAYGKLESGFGYIVLGVCEESLPAEMDKALAALGDVPGIVLDMRANNGGGTDHEAVFGRFLAADQKWLQYKGTGSAHFTGPMVVIVDAGTRSTSETVSGMFKEDGRAYMIGATPTAGMSSQKTEIVVPSKMFKVRFATGSNKERFNGGRGIEGLGVPPNEIVEWDPKLLSQGVDPFVRRAEELLKNGFPKGSVAYESKSH
jgi:carboxyl-terminal processing protease